MPPRSSPYRLIHPHTRKTCRACVMQSMAERMHATNDASNTTFSTHESMYTAELKACLQLVGSTRVRADKQTNSHACSLNLLCRTVLAGFTPAEQPRRPNVSGRKTRNFPFSRCSGFRGDRLPGLVRTDESAIYPAKGRTEQTGSPRCTGKDECEVM